MRLYSSQYDRYRPAQQQYQRQPNDNSNRDNVPKYPNDTRQNTTKTFIIRPWHSQNPDQLPMCKLPKINADDNNYDVVKIGTKQVLYPVWKPPKSDKEPQMRLLPNNHTFRFPDNTIFHFFKGCRSPGINNYGV